MIEWLLDNKQWLFSGIGVLFLSGLLEIIRKLNKRKNVDNGLTIFKGKHAWSWKKKEYLTKIYYPEPFDNIPNLTLDFPKKEDSNLIVMQEGIWKNYGHNLPKPHYIIPEQRPDGFVIEINSLGYYKPYFTWEAVGKIERNTNNGAYRDRDTHR